MKKITFILLLSILSSSFSISVQAEEKVYTIGIVPQFEIRHIRKIWNPILNEIKKKTGYKLTFVGSPTIPDFESEFSAGSFDFAYMNPYHALIANKTQGYVPLIRDTERKLQGILVVRKDSGIDSVKELDGAKISFPAPNALGASLLIRADLTKQHNIKFNPIYVKTHSSVYLNVIVKQTTAGGGVGKTLKQQKENIRGALKIIYRSPEVSPHPITAHPRVPEIVKNNIKQAFLELGKSDAGKALLSKIPMKQIGDAQLSDYTPLNEFNLDEFYVK